LWELTGTNSTGGKGGVSTKERVEKKEWGNPDFENYASLLKRIAGSSSPEREGLESVFFHGLSLLIKSSGSELNGVITSWRQGIAPGIHAILGGGSR